MIDGLSHITFIVSDLDKMEVILMKVLDAKKIYDSGDRTYSLSKERFFRAFPAHLESLGDSHGCDFVIPS